MAKASEIADYNVILLCGMLLIQYRSSALARLIAKHPSILSGLQQRSAETEEIFDEHVAIDENLKLVINSIEVVDMESLGSHIFLTEVGRLNEAEGSANKQGVDISISLSLHKIWLGSDGRQGQRATMRGLLLSDRDFSNSDLRRADFNRAHLDGANFSRANLADADLRNASLRGANVRYAILENTDLRGADLTGAIGLSGAQLALCISDDTTKTREV